MSAVENYQGSIDIHGYRPNPPVQSRSLAVAILQRCQFSMFGLQILGAKTYPRRKWYKWFWGKDREGTQKKLGTWLLPSLKQLKIAQQVLTLNRLTTNLFRTMGMKWIEHCQPNLVLPYPPLNWSDSKISSMPILFCVLKSPPKEYKNFQPGTDVPSRIHFHLYNLESTFCATPLGWLWPLTA